MPARGSHPGQHATHRNTTEVPGRVPLEAIDNSQPVKERRSDGPPVPGLRSQSLPTALATGDRKIDIPDLVKEDNPPESRIKSRAAAYNAGFRKALATSRLHMSDLRPAFGRAAYMLYLASAGDVESLKLLFSDEGEEVDELVACRDYDSRTPLHVAAAHGHLAVVHFLLQHGAPVNAQDVWDGTPLEDAVRNNHRDVVRLLSDKGGMLLNRGTGELVTLHIYNVQRSMHMGTNPWEFNLQESDLEMVPDSEGGFIGAGSFGTVHRGLWRGTPVAVKRLHPRVADDPKALALFRLELSLLSTSCHPNVVQFLGACTTKRPFLMVTEYCSGSDVKQLLRENRRTSKPLNSAGCTPLPQRDAFSIAKQIAAGMAYLHNPVPQAIMHRDLKPSNVLFADEEQIRVKITDFGLSKSIPIPSLSPDSSLRGNGRSTDPGLGHTKVVGSSLREEPTRTGSGKDGGAPFAISGRRSTSGGVPQQPQQNSPTPAANGHGGRSPSGVSKKGAGATDSSRARSIDSSMRDANHKTDATGRTGSLVYMAPEVFTRQPYGMKVDVYSYAIILYEMFEGRSPLVGSMRPVDLALDSAAGRRPLFMNHLLLPEVRQLIEDCWGFLLQAHNPDDRPTFFQICKRLEAVEVLWRKTLPNVEEAKRVGRFSRELDYHRVPHPQEPHPQAKPPKQLQGCACSIQ